MICFLTGYQGKFVYIAGSGIIGSACVKEFINAGAKVWITSRYWNGLEEIKNNLTLNEQKNTQSWKVNFRFRMRKNSRSYFGE